MSSGHNAITALRNIAANMLDELDPGLRVDVVLSIKHDMEEYLDRKIMDARERRLRVAKELEKAMGVVGQGDPQATRPDRPDAQGGQ